MTREAFKAILDPLVLALRAEVDLPTWTAYFRALQDVPPALLASAVERAAKSCTFMPKPGELRAYAEQARQALVELESGLRISRINPTTGERYFLEESQVAQDASKAREAIKSACN